MRFLRRGTAGKPTGLSDRDRADVIALAAASLGPSLVPDPTRLTDPDEAARVDLPDVVAQLRDQPRGQWPAIIAAYYAANIAAIRRGTDLEARASDWGQAQRYLAAILERGDPASRIGVAAPGLLLGTRYVLVLQDGDTVRGVLPSTVSRWGVTLDDILAAARERVRTARFSEEPLGDRTAVRVLDTAPGLWSSLLLEALDVVKPEMVGPLGTLAFLPSPNLAVVRALNFGSGLRDDLKAMAGAHYSAEADHGGAVHRNLLWRRSCGQVVEIDIQMSSTGHGPRLNVADNRFRGVLTAIEPTTQLPVPAWAPRGMTADAYTRFAGICASLVSSFGRLSSVGLPSDQIAKVKHEMPIADLARICLTVDVEHWPRILGLARRIGVRTGNGCALDLSGYQPRRFVEEHGGNLPTGLRRVLAQMPQITRAGIYGGYALRVTAAVPVRALTEGPFEIDLVVLVAHSGAGDVLHDIDRLQAACAVSMPLGIFTAIQPTKPDDPRFLDEEHLLLVR